RACYRGDDDLTDHEPDDQPQRGVQVPAVGVRIDRVGVAVRGVAARGVVGVRHSTTILPAYPLRNSRHAKGCGGRRRRRQSGVAPYDPGAIGQTYDAVAEDYAAAFGDDLSRLPL